MKLTYFQVETHLNNSLFPCYLISGEEVLLKHDTLRLIRKAANKQGFNERIKLVAEPGNNWDALYAHLHTTSLFTEKRFIEIDFRDTTPSKTVAQILEAYCTRPLSTTLLLISLGKVDDKITRSAWYHALEKNGVLIPLWPLSPAQFSQWIKQRAAKYRLQLNDEACQLLAKDTEGNLSAAAQTIEKIYLLKPATIVDAALISTVLHDDSQFTLFELIDYLIAGNITRALTILSRLQEEKIEPTLILWGITRELRLIATLAQEQQQGQSLDILFKKHRIYARKQSILKIGLSRLSITTCLKQLTYAALIDQQIKGGLTGNVWHALQLFCLRMV